MFVYILTLAIFSIVKALTRQFENQLFVFLGGSFALFGFLVVFFRVGKKTHLKEEAELEVFLRRLFK
jgi:cellobiose-specific phosphotransferase system component IIC